jgi:hypothetical protein
MGTVHRYAANAAHLRPGSRALDSEKRVWREKVVSLMIEEGVRPGSAIDDTEHPAGLG